MIQTVACDPGLQSQTGQAGARAFLADYLQPHVLDRVGCTARGLLYLDRVFEFSQQNNSQSLPTLFAQDNVETAARIAQSGARGNFLASLDRGAAGEAGLAAILQESLASHGVPLRQFHFPRLSASLAVSQLEQYREVWDSASGRVWLAGATFPALTLTDTGQHRARPACPACSSTHHSSVFRQRVTFLQQVTSALVDMVKQLSGPEQDSAKTKNPADTRLAEGTYPGEKTQHIKDVAENGEEAQDGEAEEDGEAATLRLYGLLSSFLSQLTEWQQRIETSLRKLAAAAATANKDNSAALETNSHSPYFLVGRHRNPTNLAALNRLIENYYGENITRGGPQNSPMIVKLIT